MSPTLPSPILVGRERELVALRACLDAALVGRGSLVLIGGEAGIGKTALAEALCREATERGALVLVGRCYDLTETPPYGPWIDLFGRYEHTGGMPPLPDAFAERGTVGAVASQALLFQQVLDFLMMLAARRPVILLLDDLHWADPASLDLLRFLARALPDARILLVSTYRADVVTRRHPLYMLLPVLVRESRSVRLGLQPFTNLAVHAFVATRYALPPGDEARLVAYLSRRAEGNPLFTGEVLRTLEESHVLQRGEGRWVLGDVSRTPIPTLLKQVIDGRVGRLGEEVRTLLEVAAVIGQDISLSLWAAMSGITEDALLEAVEPAIAVALLAEAPDNGGLRFSHALVREALYEGTAAARRRRLHRQSGETLAISPNADPDAVAYHFQHAGDTRAVDWLVRAGERAQRTFAWLTAAERYRAALTLLPNTGEGAAERGWLLYRHSRMRRYEDTRDSLASLDEALQLAEIAGDRALDALVHWTRGNVRYIGLQEYEALPEVVAAVETIATLLETERERIRAFEPTLAAYPPAGLATPYICIGRYRDLLAIAEGMPAPLRDGSIEDPITAVGGGRGGQAGYISLYGIVGRPVEAFAFARHHSARFRATRNYYRLAQIIAQELFLALTYETDDIALRERLAAGGEEAFHRTGTIGYGYTERVIWLDILVLEGRWEEARSLVDAEEHARNRVTPWLSSGFPGFLIRSLGENDGAWRLVREAVPGGVASEPGAIPFLRAQHGQRLAAVLCLDEGDLPKAHAWLQAHDRWLAWGGAALGASEGQALWAEYHRAAGDYVRAGYHAGQALARATTPRQPLALIAAHRLLGELETHAARHADAAQHLDAALALADACAAPYERALTLLALAELHAATGTPVHAHTLVDEARAICERLGAVPALARADALAARLAAPAPSSAAHPAGLTAREAEVLRHLAAGRTNRDIADLLFLSPATVNIHVTRVLAKTESANRTVAAAFAHRHGLA